MRLFAAVILLSCAVNIGAASSSEIETQRLSERVYLLTPSPGMGSNVGVVVGDDGVLLIDAMRSEATQALAAAVKSISDKPVRFVINTHSNFDHTGANSYYSERGATIISHRNAIYSDAHTTMRFDNALEFEFEGMPIELTFAPAHTFDDILIRLPTENLIFLGDNFETGWHPTFYSFGGEELSAARMTAMAQSDEGTLYIPGHGRAVDHDSFLTALNDFNSWLEFVGKQHRAGASADEIAASAKAAAYRKALFGEDADTERSITAFRRFVARTLATDFVDIARIDIPALNKFVGVYDASDSVYEVAIYLGRLVLRRRGDFIQELLPLKRGGFAFRGDLNGERVDFLLTDDGVATDFVWSTTDGRIEAQKRD